MRKAPRALAGAVVVVAGVVMGAASGARADYTITTPGGNWSTFVGQNFSPSLGGAPDPGLAAGDTVYLSSFTFTRGGNGPGAAGTRLALLPGAYYDTNGDPNGSFAPTIANAVGISTNAIDTTAAVAGTPLVFQFNNLPLMYGDNYEAVFVTVGANDVLNFQLVGAYAVNYAEDPVGSGQFHPTSNYGGANNYNASALYTDGNGDGYFEAFGEAADTAFTATFVVPEPGVAGLVSLVAWMLTNRRRR